jgi:hypothetical protein
MKKLVEKVILAFCYLVTINASIRMYASLIMDTEKLTTPVVFNLIIVGFALVFLSVMAFILLFTKRPND